MRVDFVSNPNDVRRLGDYLRDALTDTRWISFEGAVAFVKESGVAHIEQPLRSFSERSRVRITAGVDLGGTSFEALSRVHAALQPNGELYVFQNRSVTFHPKIFLFEDQQGDALALVGSGNLTEGGLYTNYEGFCAMQLSAGDSNDATVLGDLRATLTSWRDTTTGLARLADTALLSALREAGILPTEAAIAGSMRSRTVPAAPGQARCEFFPSIAVPSAPSTGSGRRITSSMPVATSAAPIVSVNGGPIGFIMTLQRTDVGTGQLTAGASRRSPEIFIPLAARDASSSFWGWPNLFQADPRNPGKMDRRGVRMRIGGEIVEVNMMTWPLKHDFRLRSEALRSAGAIGDILRMEVAPSSAGFQYYVEIVPAGTTQHAHYHALCVNRVAGASQKRWGYYNVTFGSEESAH